MISRSKLREASEDGEDELAGGAPGVNDFATKARYAQGNAFGVQRAFTISQRCTVERAWRSTFATTSVSPLRTYRSAAPSSSRSAIGRTL
jgi:hypothetical protein